MKFEELIMEETKEQKMKHALEEVAILKAELHKEEELNKVLKAVVEGPILTQPQLSLHCLPPKVEELIEELGTVEAEILSLEKQVELLKVQVYHERQERENKELEIQMDPEPKQKRPNKKINLIPPGTESNITGYLSKDDNSQQRSRSQNYELVRTHKMKGHRRVSIGSGAEFLNTTTSSTFNEEFRELSRMHTSRMRNRSPLNDEEKPNAISEELTQCLLGIYLELNEAISEKQGPTIVVPKLSHGIGKNKISSMVKSPSCSSKDNNASSFDPYGVLTDLDDTLRDIGPYKNFIHVTKSSVHVARFPECSVPIAKLRVLMDKLSIVDLSSLTYKQKLAFWINIYNSCIMHAFLEHGLPSSQEKLLELMNKGSLNVGGIVLNALAIEHFILRQPCEPQFGSMDEKEVQLRHTYGLGYSEPNITFALCRGSWSSPALRVYTPEDIVNDLGRARGEYLEASVGVTSKRKIVVPRLLQWHMRDFADDMDSLLEWIYSELPRGSLKGMIMECLQKKTKTSITKIIQIQPYDYEFRYLLTL